MSRKALSRWLLSALLLQSLLPALAGVRIADSARWIEVCVSTGVQWVKVSDANGGASVHADEHCALCATPGAAPEFDVRRYLPEADGLVHPAFAGHLPVRSFPSFQHQSRAPPR